MLPEDYKALPAPCEPRGNLESAIRSALASPGHLRADTVKSVKWDPAVVSYGPITSAKPPGTERIVESLQAITESVSIITKQADELEDYVNTVVQWKKPERQKLQRLLDALEEIDTHANPVPKPDSDNASSKSKATSNNAHSKSLNPCAPVFRDIITMRSQISSQKPDVHRGLTTLTIPRRRPRIAHDPHRGLQSPTWIRTSIPLPVRKPLTQQFSSNPPATFSRPNASNPQPQANPQCPIVWPAIPIENEHGRVAQTIEPAWAEAILEKFISKYPMTGKVKSASPATAQGRHAAAIQQRLEYLLMQEKEKKALEEMSRRGS